MGVMGGMGWMGNKTEDGASVFQWFGSYAPSLVFLKRGSDGEEKIEFGEFFVDAAVEPDGV